MVSIPIEDINYLAEQSSGKINMILSGMTALMNDTDNKIEAMESQGWFKRMVKTVSGKNKLTKDEIRKNHDKLNAYMSQAIAELYNRNCIDEKVMMSLGTQLNELYADHIQLKQMLGAFVSKLNEKIDSVDNFHMLTTEINQGVYSFDTPIFSICKITSRFDKRILEDSRKLDILRRSMVSQNIINDEQIKLTDYLMNIIEIPIDEIGQIYLELGTIKDNFVSKVILGIIEKYHFLPDMARKIKNKDSLIEEVINNEKLDGAIELSISDIYDDIVNSKIDVQNILVRDLNIEGEDNLEKSEQLYIGNKTDDGVNFSQYTKTDIHRKIKLYCEDVAFRARKESKNNLKFHASRKLKYGLGIGYCDEVYLGHDDSVFQSGKVGFAITSDGIFSRQSFSYAINHIKFRELSNIINFYCMGGNLYGDNKILAVCSLCSDFEKSELIKLFKFIKNLFI